MHIYISELARICYHGGFQTDTPTHTHTHTHDTGDLALVCPDVYTTLLKLKQIVKQKKDIRADAALSDEAKVTL
jgi:hypothetical protein